MERLHKFLNESQDPKTVEKILNKITDLLMKEEKIEYIAVQKRPGINISPDSIALTNRRIIFCRPKNLGLSMEFEDFLWKEVEDCHIKEGVLGATFTVNPVKKDSIKLDYLPKAQARLLYRYAQEQEEKMTEYRRQMELEDARAKAGGNIMVNTKPDADKQSGTEKEDPTASLRKLKEFFEQDLISREEYEKKKAEILDKL